MISLIEIKRKITKKKTIIMKKGAQKKAIESYLQENIGNNPVILATWLKYLIPLKDTSQA